MSDVFRKEYSPLTDEQKKKMNDIKSRAETLLLEIDDIEFVKDQRCRALAITNLEQAVMWAIKAIT